MDTYRQAVLEARDAVAEITKQDAIHVNAACSGGIVSAAAVGRLQASGELSTVASLTLFVCAIDSTRATDAEAPVTREVAAAAVAESARKGYLDGQALAGVFAWLRPNDMVWNYVVNNYLLGKEPPAFDSSTGTRTPSASQPGCIATSCSWGWRTRWRAPASTWRSGRRSTSAPSTWTPTSWPACATTSCPGRRRTAAPCSWAGTNASSCRPAGTSRRL